MPEYLDAEGSARSNNRKEVQINETLPRHT